MTRLPLFLLLFISAVAAAGCGAKQNPDEPTDDCSGDPKSSSQYGLVHAGASWSTSTPLAAGDCTSGYTVFVRWARAARRDTSTRVPPVSFTFNPTGVAGLVLDLHSTSGGPSAYPGKGWFVDAFSPEPPTTSGGNTTSYKIMVQVNSSNPDDSVEVYTITTYHLAK